MLIHTNRPVAINKSDRIRPAATKLGAKRMSFARTTVTDYKAVSSAPAYIWVCCFIDGFRRF